MNFGTLLRTAASAFPLVMFAAASHAGGYVAPVIEPAVLPSVEMSAPVGPWQGAYIGGTIGYAFEGKDRVGLSDTPNSTVYTIDTLKLSGAQVGLRLGYRWQNNNWVFGPELGYEGGSIKDDFRDVLGYSAQSKIKNVVALRFKTGYLVQPDTQVYGIVGAARAKIDNYYVEGTGALGAGVSSSSIRESFNRSGYIVGLGAEKQLNDSWSVTGEYEYANFGKRLLDDGSVHTRATPKYHSVKLGVNYRF